MCHGCENNVTKNKDKWGKSFCQRSKACKAIAAAFYAEKGVVITAPAPAPKETAAPEEEDSSEEEIIVSKKSRSTRAKRSNK